MNQAFDENGNIILLTTYSRNELKRLKNNKYYCLSCKKQLVLKIGERNRPHFSHKSSFVKKEHRGESNHHKHAIELLYETFRRQKLITEKEFFIASINQRPDLIVKSKKQSYAIEFQASQISLTLFRKRTHNLKKAGYKPIWILSHRLLKIKGNILLKITPFLSQFIHRRSNEHPPQLYFLNPDRKKMIVLEHIMMISENLAYVQKRVIYLKDFTFNKLNTYLPLNVHQLLVTWQNKKMNFRTKVRSRAYGAEYQWRLWLYKQKIHFELLPSIIHLPSRDNFYFKVPPWNWQSRLILQVISPLGKNGTFTYSDCLNTLRKYLIPPTHYPLIESPAYPIKNYLKLLTHLQIIKPLSKTKYMKIKNLEQNLHLKQTIIADDDIINQLLYNLK